MALPRLTELAEVVRRQSQSPLPNARRTSRRRASHANPHKEYGLTGPFTCAWRRIDRLARIIHDGSSRNRAVAMRDGHAEP